MDERTFCRTSVRANATFDTIHYAEFFNFVIVATKDKSVHVFGEKIHRATLNASSSTDALSGLTDVSLLFVEEHKC